jgi:carbon storage regulator
MLVISRKQGERIVIGEGIEVIVLGTNGCRVRLGVQAPPEVKVHREEIAKRIKIQEEKWKQYRDGSMSNVSVAVNAS